MKRVNNFPIKIKETKKISLIKLDKTIICNKIKLL